MLMTLLATLQIDWNPWGPTWLVIAVLAVLVVFLGRLYATDARRLGKRQRWLLLAWRIMTVIVVLLALMEPTYRLVTTERRPPVAAVVLDESLSMSLPAARDNPYVDYLEKDRAKRSRYHAARLAAADHVAGLAKTHRIKLYVVSDRIQSVADFAQGSAVAPEDLAKAFDKFAEPTGNFSNLGEALVDILNDSPGIKLSGITFMSDGRLTGGQHFDVAGRLLAERGVPVHTVGLGTVEPLPDLRFLDVIAPAEANVNDVMTIQATIVNTLRPNLPVELLFLKDDAPEPILTRKLILPLGEQRVSLSTVPTEEGEVSYKLRLPIYPDELDDTNNEASFYVNVVRRRLKVLLIAGSPTMEFHHMVPSLVRDRIVDVSCYLQSADVNAIQQGNDVIAELPRTPAEWNRYDVVFLYDINPNRFTAEQENGLELLVRNGGGLFFIAGRAYGMATLLQVRGSKMRAMLSVEINRNLPPDHDQLFREPFRIVRTPAGQSHPIMIFAPGREKNDEIWRSFGDLDFFWNHPIMDVKREAVPLLVKERRDGGTAAGSETIFAIMKYGQGTTAFLGVHDMWRWRFPMESFDYDQFWSQTARYLAEYRMLGTQRQIVIATDKKMYSPGEPVRMQLDILDPALAAQLRTEQVFATITDEQEGIYSVMMRSAAGQDVATQFGNFTARRLGEHEVRARHILSTDLAAQKALFDETTHFTVRMQSLEFADTTADLGALRDLAEQTGGIAIDHATMGEGLKTLAFQVDATPQMVPRESYADLWDRWYVLAILLVLVTLELWFRRHWGLL